MQNNTVHNCSFNHRQGAKISERQNSAKDKNQPGTKISQEFQERFWQNLAKQTWQDKLCKTKISQTFQEKFWQNKLGKKLEKLGKTKISQIQKSAKNFKRENKRVEQTW
jgi:hypothetical protein